MDLLLRLAALLIVALAVCAEGARIRRRQRREVDVAVEEDREITGAEARLDITKLLVRSDVSLRFATTYVTSHVTNLGQSAAEAVFDLRMPKSAFITKFTMEIGGRNYSGTVKEKEVANKEYQRAVSRGQSAAQVKKNPRATDRFSVNVNVEASGDVTFYLVYQEALKRRHGLYSNVIYVDPGQIVADFKIEVHINETREVTDLYVPPISQNDTDATMLTLETMSDANIEFLRPSEVLVTYTPTPANQRRQSEKGLSGKFVVIYDVLRNFDGGEVAVEDGYFVHYFSPSGLPIINKNVLFVLDTSGSMYGTKMRQVKDAMESILRQLREGDFFNIVRFSSGTSRFNQEEAMVSVTPDSTERALEFVTNLQATGGTNVNDAILSAINLLSEHDWRQETELSSLIIFLTDGDPTSGVTNIRTILDNIRGRNEGRYPLYSLGFGHTVNFKFLKRLSLQNSGMARKIYEDADAGLQLQGFFRDVSSPLLNDVTFDYVGGVNDSSLTRRIFPTFYNGSEIMICGMLEKGKEIDDLKSVIGARSKDDYIDIELPIPVPRPYPIPPVGCVDMREPPIDPPIIADPPVQPPIRCPPYPHPTPEPREPGRIERLWAYQTINQYLEYMLATTNNTEKQLYKKKALDLSLKYQFVTSLTSMVVVKPDESESLPDTANNRRGYQFAENGRSNVGYRQPSRSRGRAGGGMRRKMLPTLTRQHQYTSISFPAGVASVPQGLPGPAVPSTISADLQPVGLTGSRSPSNSHISVFLADPDLNSILSFLDGVPASPMSGSSSTRSESTDPQPESAQSPSRRQFGYSFGPQPESAQSPSRRQFGYSFADGDPHFLVTVPGSPSKPLCFNIRGEVGSEYMLLNDSVHDVLVSGKMIQGELQRGGTKRRTYFGEMTVRFGQNSLKISPTRINLNGARPQTWANFKDGLTDQGDVFMPNGDVVKVRLDTGAILVVVRHKPRSGSVRTVAYLGFYVENIGLLSGMAEGLTGDFAHSHMEDMSRPGSTLVRFRHGGATGGRMVRVREITRRNLVTRQQIPCYFVGRGGRDVLRRNLNAYKIRNTN